MITKKEIEELRKIKGKVRGVTFKTDIKYIESLKGKKEAEIIQKKIKEIDPAFKFKEIKNTEWYPLWWRILSILIIEDHYKWKERDLFNMGHAAPSNSFVVKIILRYFISFKKTCVQASTYWGKHYSVGDFETTEFNPKEKKVIYTLRNFKTHPSLCIYLKGYFKAITELTNKSKNISIKETDCIFKNDKYHRFKIKW